ncbi:hypothetical protein [Oryzibacter oryziterrae]|uniref:hypothetical protein n=1 Tax=Oryzibacter oryziterrae TaxID=2766474 RepID=UPI001F29B472|nr:hypothetical protein [Oryzibacter oryziterrae]
MSASSKPKKDHSERNIRLWIALLLSLAALCGNVPASIVTDALGALASDGLEKALSDCNWWLVAQAVGFGGLALALSYLGLSQFGLFGVRVLDQSSSVRVNALIITLSPPMRDHSKDSESAVEDNLKLLEAAANGSKKVSTGTEMEEATLESLIAPIATIDRLSLDKLAWQQSWRTIDDQLGEDSHLEQIILIIGSYYNKSKEREDELKTYIKLTQEIVNKRTATLGKSAISLDTRTVDNDDLESIQKLFNQLITNISTNKNNRIGIDITGGDRIYAFAAATTALAKNVYMFYVRGGENEAHKKEIKVECYDVAPKLQSF